MRSRLVHSESFRQAAANAAIFAVAMVILFAVVFFTLDQSFKATLMREVNDDLGAIAAVYAEKNADNPDKKVREIIQGRLLDPDADDAFLLQRNGRLVAGNIPVMTPRIGVFTMPMPPLAHDTEEGHKLLGRGVFVAPGVYAYVGRDLVFVGAAENYILYAFGVVLAVSLVLSGVSALMLSRSFLRRVDAVTGTCRHIMAGRLSERIPAVGRGEFQELGAAINAMLDRIQVLMESLRQVSTDIAHDMRTPLTHLRQKLEKTRDESVSIVQYSQAVDGAIADCDKLLGIFTALLRIAQIEAGQRRAEFADVDLMALAAKLADIYVPVMEDMGHRFSVSLAAVPRVKGDGQLLMQLVSNLLDNAIAHTPPGTVVELCCGQEGGRTVLCVSDNGPGVKAEERDKLTRRFYRGEQSRSTPGSGLGLALAAAVAELHQGELVLADNKPGLRVSLLFRTAPLGR